MRTDVPYPVLKVSVLNPEPPRIWIEGPLGQAELNGLTLSLEQAQDLFDKLSEALARAKGHIVVGSSA